MVCYALVAITSFSIPRALRLQDGWVFPTDGLSVPTLVGQFERGESQVRTSLFIGLDTAKVRLGGVLSILNVPRHKLSGAPFSNFEMLCANQMNDKGCATAEETAGIRHVEQHQ